MATQELTTPQNETLEEAPGPTKELFQTTSLNAPHGSFVYAPDGSIVRPLLAFTHQGSMAHFELMSGQISKAITHRTVNEIWYVISGEGRMWRKTSSQEETVTLKPGVCLTIPVGTHFQFRSDNYALNVIAVTMPPWTGDEEAIEVRGHWELHVH